MNRFDIKLKELTACSEIIKELEESENKDNSISELNKRIERNIDMVKAEEVLNDLNSHNIAKMHLLCKMGIISVAQRNELIREVNKNYKKALTKLNF